MVTFSQKMECAELLSHVQRAESMLPESSDAYFGHPPPPDLHVIQLPRGNLHLGAAVTKRCVSSQLWEDQVSTGEPLEILCLSQVDTNDAEEITCAALLALDPKVKVGENALYAAIVVGTSASRVLSVELKIQLSGVDGKPLLSLLPLFEPLPLDSNEDVADESSVTSYSRHDRRGGADPLRNSQHGSPKKGSSLSSSLHGSTPRKDSPGKPDVKFVRFRPNGGVTSVSPYRVSLNDEDLMTCVVWVAYRDGTMVRLHHASFFSSIVRDTSFSDDLAAAVFHSCVQLPPSVEGITVIPLPKYHPSPLAPLPPWKPPRHDENDMESPASTSMHSDDEDHQDDEEPEDAVPDFHEALVFAGDSGTGADEQFPALSFYTSEDQFVGRIAGDDHEGRILSSNHDGGFLGHVVGGTATLVSGVFGTAFGVVKWGLGRQSEKVCHVSRETMIDMC